jgi:hypothetical protein
MISSILKFLGGIGSFISHITSFFIDGDVRKRQRDYDELLAKYKNLKESMQANNLDCESRISKIRIEHDMKIASLEDEIASMKTVNKTPRRIEG